MGDLCWVDGKKYGVPKKRSTKKFGRNEVKYYDFKDIFWENIG